MGDISTGTGSKIYIGPVNTTADDETAYAALSYTKLGLVESVGPHGDTAATITFADLEDARVRKRKGVRDAGDVNIVVANDPRDAGQLAMIAAEATNFTYAFKLVLADAPDANDTDTTRYWRALVSTANLQELTNDAVNKRAFTALIDSKIVEIPSEAVA